MDKPYLWAKTRMDRMESSIKVIREKLDELEKQVAHVRDENLLLKCIAQLETEHQSQQSSSEIESGISPPITAEEKAEVAKLPDTSEGASGQEDAENFYKFEEDDVKDQIAIADKKISALKRRIVEVHLESNGKDRVHEHKSQNINSFSEEKKLVPEDFSTISTPIFVPSIREIARENVYIKWKDVPGIKEQPLFKLLKQKEKECQEAKFELMVTELTFLNQMNVLLDHYKKTIYQWLETTSKPTNEFDSVIFKYVEPIHSCSNDFLNGLDQCWKSDFMMRGFFKIIEKHAMEKLKVFFVYIVNHVDAVPRLNDIKNENSLFDEMLDRLKDHMNAKNQSLERLLEIPSSRITQLALILKRIINCTDSEHEELEHFQRALTSLKEVTQYSNYAVAVKELERELQFPTWMRKPSSMVFYGQKVVNDTDNLKVNDRTLRAVLLSDRIILTEAATGRGKNKVWKQYTFDDAITNEMAGNKLSIKVGVNGTQKKLEFQFSDSDTYTVWLNHLRKK